MENTFHVCIVINPATGTWQPGMCPITQHIYWCLLKWRMHSTCAPVQHCHYTVYNLFMFVHNLFVRHQRSCKGFTDDVSCFHHQSLWSEVSGEALRFDMLSGRWLRLSDPIIQCNMTKLSMLAVSLKWIIVFTKCFHHIIILFELGKDKPRNHFHSPNRIVLKRFSIYYILEKYVCRVV